MFALRKIIENTQTNYALGVQYQVIERLVDYDTFALTFKHEFGYEHVADDDVKADNYTKNCYAFISTQDFAAIPLYMNQKNYIMTESGATFSNLTYK
jgi:PKD repeat protein